MKRAVKKMYVIKAGTLKLAANTLKADSEQDFVKIPVPVYLFETEDGWVLFDTGCDPVSVSMFPPNAYTPEEGAGLPIHLQKLNVDPADVKHIILSHLHSDHIGLIRYFAGATVLVSGTELTESLRLYATGEADNMTKRDLDGLFSSRMHYLPLLPEVKQFPFCPGLTILNLGPGHSFGMLALFVELECGNFVIASDAIYCKEHGAPDYIRPGRLEDEDAYYKTVRGLEEFAREKKAVILFGHDEAQFATLKKAPDYYE